MRVTPTTMALTVRLGVERSLGRVQDAQDRMSTGRRIGRYSDAPSDATAALRLRAQEADWAAFSRAADDSLGWLSMEDTALQSANDLLQRARELTVSAANSARSAVEREALAAEIEHLRDQLASVANTTYLGRPVFGGFCAAAVADAGGWTFAGDDGAVLRRIAPDVTLRINVDGAAAFGFTAGNDVFRVLDRIAADVRSGDVGALGTTDLADLDARARDIGTALATVGATMNRVESTRTAGAAHVDSLRAARSDLEDADLAQTVAELQMAEIGYQAALGALARVSMPSLAEFLR